MKILKLSLLLVLIIFQISSAQDGLALLKVGHGANQSGIGEATVSISNEVDGAYYNPAAIWNIEKFTASFGHTTYWENISLESGFFAAPISNRINLHGGIRFASVDHIEKRVNPTEEPLSEFDFQDISLKFGFTYLKSEKMTLGFAGGWLYEKNDLWSGSSFNIDLGMQYKVNTQLQLGAAVTNLGSSFQLTANGEPNSNDISLPTRYSVGGNYQFDTYTTAVDLVILDDELKVHMGAEAKVHEMLDVRAGYMLNYDSKNISAGASFKKNNIKIDYAFVPYSNDLGTTHLFNFTFSI